MKKHFLLVLVIMLVLSFGITASAGSVNKGYQELLGLSGQLYKTEYDSTYEEQLESILSKEITRFIVSEKVVNIKDSGDSEFVDAIVEYVDGSFQNVSPYVNWKSLDTNVVFADQGRILALDKGNTSVIVSFLNFEHQIKVNVSAKKNIEEEILKVNRQNSNDEMSINSTYLREYVTNKAKSMVDISWTPTQNLVGWKAQFTFEKGKTYKGIPYSQTVNQRDEKGFASSLSASDFYTAYTRFDIIMPRYGNDCSGFLSFAWGTSRKTTADFVNGIKDGTYKKVGTYNANNPTTSELLSAYRFLQRGDAVVKSGHTFMIASNNTSTKEVMVYEQTPYRAIYTTWTYDKMANDKYMPFTLHYMDDPIEPYSMPIELEQ